MRVRNVMIYDCDVLLGYLLLLSLPTADYPTNTAN